MGTPYYMSPEQISGSKGVDFRSDLWALGVIACECLTGRRPFEAETIGGLALKICAEAAPRPSALGSVPPAFDAWFERATARDANQRFQSARELADSLRAVCSGAMALDGATVLATAGNPSVPTPHFGHTETALSRSADHANPFRTRAKAPIVVGALAVVALGAVGLWLRSARPESAESAARSASVVPPAAPPVLPPPKSPAEVEGAARTAARPAPTVDVAPAVAAPAPAAPVDAPALGAAPGPRPQLAPRQRRASGAPARPAASGKPSAPVAAGKPEAPPPSDVLDERR
jgi:serine/threonine-protein kinase